MNKEETEKLGPEYRMTNLELWQTMLEGMPETPAEKELERRLRKIGFFPALPLKEDGS